MAKTFVGCWVDRFSVCQFRTYSWNQFDAIAKAIFQFSNTIRTHSTHVRQPFTCCYSIWMRASGKSTTWNGNFNLNKFDTTKCEYPLGWGGRNEINRNWNPVFAWHIQIPFSTTLNVARPNVVRHSRHTHTQSQTVFADIHRMHHNVLAFRWKYD